MEGSTFLPAAVPPRNTFRKADDAADAPVSSVRYWQEKWVRALRLLSEFPDAYRALMADLRPTPEASP